ncbi:glycoside hydrolase family 99-like domain-containing protein [Limnoglobus roseus]|uniref:Uncharacterized protein n=1 Tax=Limnoglobus roseus TaxID=2598579 RepID=A0A5C1A8J8_9BACT|nr:hypothetical protein PX52LOC_02476 [Limnoglobus roseus]
MVAEDVTRVSPLIAFHLPQYHPIPENDEWWGKGFTEWANVTRAVSLFPGHYQPHLPADLGFYDLRLPEARAAQAQLAREYGIGGFCYYHYWFSGRRLLHRPVDEILQSGEPDFPFCLCWANEPWSRNWDGGFKKVLVHQHYSEDDDLNHIRWLLPAFADRRYIRVDGKPLFLVYRSGQLPDPQRTTDIWREEARKCGVGELFLACVEPSPTVATDPSRSGMDALVQFTPEWHGAPRKQFFDSWRRLVRARLYSRGRWLTRVIDSLLRQLSPYMIHATRQGRVSLRHKIRDYEDVVYSTLRLADAVEYRLFRCVCPGWDNTARRKSGGMIFVGSTPELYESWLRTVVDRQRRSCFPGDPIFVNAWNEWAEGCHLEPCQKWGRSYLEATARAIKLCDTDSGGNP